MTGLGMIVALITVASATAAPAAARTLIEQPPGPSGVALPSDEGPERSLASDDFDVPVGQHWHPEAIEVFGKAAIEHPPCCALAATGPKAMPFFSG